MAGKPEIEITLKEVFERIVALETKFNLTVEENKKVTKQFVWFVVIILVLQLVNIAVHIVYSYK